MSLAKIRLSLRDDGPKGDLGSLKYHVDDMYAGPIKMMAGGEAPSHWQEAKDIGTSSPRAVGCRKSGIGPFLL